MEENHGARPVPMAQAWEIALAAVVVFVFLPGVGVLVGLLAGRRY